MIRTYGYNPSTDTYYEDRGGVRRVIPQSSIKLDVNRYVMGIQQEQREITRRLISEEITSQQWYEESARMLKLSTRAVTDVARGTDEPMTDEERARLLLLLLLLFRKLNRTAEALNSGSISLDGNLLTSAGLRGATPRASYENWRVTEHQARGYTEARRVLGVAEHCERSGDRPGCVELAALGWVQIERLIAIGEATCREHCKCTVEYRGRRVRLLV